VGQTGRNLKQRYKEHIRYIWNNDPQSAYATHIINNLHEFRDINDNMSILKQTNKGPYMNTLEQFYIQLFAYNNKLIPEQNTGDYSPIFRFIYDIQKVTPPCDRDLLKYRIHNSIASTVLTTKQATYSDKQVCTR
jgi:hypothetical protein